MSLSKQLAQFDKMLGNTATWLDQAVQFAEAREMDPEALLDVRLYPDQFTLRRNVQSIADIAKLTAARLCELDAPKHEDGDQSIAELKDRLAEVRSFMAAIDAATADAAATRFISPALFGGKGMSGTDYVTEFAAPNFYFHCTTAYALLRHVGVPLGKRVYLGSLSLTDG